MFKLVRTSYFGTLSNSFLASGDLCHLLITFANSLDPDQDQHTVGPDLDPNSLTLLVSLKDFFINLGKSHSMKNYPACKELNMNAQLPRRARGQSFALSPHLHVHSRVQAGPCQ